ncbi:hypothetical protein ILYODFUR_020673 [Ilyodon furcidens]|uniref:Uncharacterized protein n=1 Tax=Ilyodon furcidens TaxID=33524 RepID=A0ABV0V5F6_9TELE
MEFCLHIQLFAAFVLCLKVCAQMVPNEKHPGLQVLATASHYWPLDVVDGIHELWDEIGDRPRYVSDSEITVRIHNHTVLPSSHNSSYVYTNDSAYTNISAIVDIVEGVYNRGIFLNSDNGGSFLHFGNYQNSCMSDPILCGLEDLIVHCIVDLFCFVDDPNHTEMDEDRLNYGSVEDDQQLLWKVVLLELPLLGLLLKIAYV